jgi:pullulanase/glycogen debranching enzyme
VDLIANSLNQENAVEWFKFSAIHQSSRLRDYVLDFLELHESVNKLRKFGEGIWPKMCGK